MALAHTRRGRFAAERWLRADGDLARLGDAAMRDGWTCTGPMCMAQLRDKLVVYYFDDAKIPADCGAADIVIAQFPLRGKCRAAELKIDRFDVWRKGAYAVYVKNGNLHVKTSQGERGSRPWVFEPAARKTIRNTPEPPRKQQTKPA